MKIISCFIRIIMNLVIRLFGLFIPKCEKFIIFGSWLGDSYSDNTRYLFEYMIEKHKDFKLIWVGKNHLREKVPKADNVIFCRRNSLKSIYYMLRSKYAFLSQGIHDLFDTNIFNRTCLIYLSHGAALKKWGDDDISKRVTQKKDFREKLKSLYRKILGGWPKYDYCVVTSTYHGNCVRSALAYLGGQTTKLIYSGYPRNDMLLKASNEQIKLLKEKYAQLLGFSPQNKIILYAPTFRRLSKEVESFCNRNEIETQKIVSILDKNNAVFLEKNHYVFYQNNNINPTVYRNKNLIYLNKDNSLEINIQELLLVVDILISDYSSILFDYVLLDKPSICFVYDYEYYKNIDSGLYYEIEDYSTGRITRTFDETCEEIERLLNGIDNYAEKRKYVRKKFMPFDNGNASERILNEVLKNVDK